MPDARIDWHARIRTACTTPTHSPDEDVLEELAQHATAVYAAARADGDDESSAEQRVIALIATWRAEAPVLRHRRSRAAAVAAPPASSVSLLAGLFQDVRYGARLLLRDARHTAVVVGTLGVAIAATTTLFSVVHGVLARPLPWPNAARLVSLAETRGGVAPRFGAFSNAAYLAWKDDARTLEGLAAWSVSSMTVTGGGEPERVRVVNATPELFGVLGVRPALGTFFADAGDSPSIVLSEREWRVRFAARPDVIGSVLHLDGRPFTIVGVLAERQMFPDPRAAGIVPFSVRPTAGNYLSMFNAVGLLQPGSSATQAAAEGTARGRSAAPTGLTTMAIFGNDGPVGVTVTPLLEAITGATRRPLLLLLTAVGLLLLTATANVANLQLARAASRTRELAIRSAIGAGTGRIVRQLLIESVLLALAGGAAGLLAAGALHGVILTLLPPDFPRPDDIRLDGWALAFTMAVSTASGLLFGLAPALRIGRTSVATAMADGAAPIGGGKRGAASWTRTAMMTAQVTIACVLLVGASLLGRSFLALLHTDRGYDLSGLWSARLSIPPTIYPDEGARRLLVDRLLGRLAAAPGTSEAAFTSELPLSAGGSTAAFDLRSGDGRVVKVQASPRIVSPRYFAAMRIPTTAGRTFDERDTAAAGTAVVVNEEFARRYLGEQAVGRQVPIAGYQAALPGRTEATIVGVVGNVRYADAAAPTLPEMYFNHVQMAGLPVQTITLLTRTLAEVSTAPALRGAVRDVSPLLAVDAVVPLEQRMLTLLARPRLFAWLIGAFAGSALAIAGAGLIGLLSYSVSLRGRELAIRSALGARRADIVRLVLRQGLGAAGTGTAIGLAAAALAARVLASRLYGVTSLDAFTFLGVPAALLATAAAACIIPARRAARLDPLQVLKRG